MRAPFLTAVSSAALLTMMGGTAEAVKLYTPTEAMEVAKATGRPILAVDGSAK